MYIYIYIYCRFGVPCGAAEMACVVSDFAASLRAPLG